MTVRVIDLSTTIEPSEAPLARQRYVRGGKLEQIRRFRSILRVARKMNAADPQSLLGLIRLLGRSVQARLLISWVHGMRSGLNGPEGLLFPVSTPITPDGRCLNDFALQVTNDNPALLGHDVILPWPWNGKRLIKALSGLRPDGSWGSWTQDFGNHEVWCWLPINVYWVSGGNHSIAAGIAYGTGEVKPELTYDISEVYKYVECDGLVFKKIHDGETIGLVNDLEMAAIFEIGRLMAQPSE